MRFISSLRKYLSGLGLMLALFLVFKSVGVFADNHKDTHGQESIFEVDLRQAELLQGVETEAPFNPTAIIMEHISDSHDWHLWGHTSIGLPVLLWTNKGWAMFTSSAFHHDQEGKTLVSAAGHNFVRFSNKIYYAENPSTDGSYIILDDNSRPLNSAPLDFSITKGVAAMMISAGILVLIFFGVASGYSARKGKAPKGLQSVLEPIILFVRDDIARPNIGRKYELYMPFLLSLFFFIWINNLLGMMPFFPGGVNVTGNIAVTFVLGVFAFFATVLSGNKYYWKHIFMPDVPWWLYPIMIVVEVIGVLSKPFSLIVRLFANITAGHIIILSLVSLIFIFKSFAVAPISVAFVLFMNVLEMLVAFLQAFIFTMLTALFIGMAVDEHGHDHDEEHENSELKHRSHTAKS